MNIWLLCIFVVTQIVDGWMTWKILRRGGVELNPVMAKLMDEIGDVPALAASKLAGAAFFGCLCFAYPADAQLALLMIVVIVGYGFVIDHNFEQYDWHKAGE